MKPMISVAAMSGLVETLGRQAQIPISSCKHSSWIDRFSPAPKDLSHAPCLPAF